MKKVGVPATPLRFAVQELVVVRNAQRVFQPLGEAYLRPIESPRTAGPGRYICRSTGPRRSWRTRSGRTGCRSSPAGGAGGGGVRSVQGGRGPGESQRGVRGAGPQLIDAVRWRTSILSDPGRAFKSTSAQRSSPQRFLGFRWAKSVAISSKVAQRTPSWVLMWSTSRSCISSTWGRPDTSGWMVMVKAA
jgi:hypothetical protein